MQLSDIDKLAKLARIDIPKEEKEEFLRNLESILAYVGQVQEVSANASKKIDAQIRNVFREDVVRYKNGDFTEKLLKEAPETQDGFVKVKQIL